MKVTSTNLNSAPTPRRTLRVAHDAAWFERDGAGRVELARRGPLLLLFARLVEEHELRPGSALSTLQLLGAAWPHERVLVEAGTHRVHVAISTLRKLGLRDIIERRHDGYRIAPDVAFVRKAAPRVAPGHTVVGSDPLDILETAYTIDGSDEDWFTRIAESVYASVPFETMGVVVNAYDISDPERPQLAQGFFCAAPDVRRLEEGWRELTPVFQADHERTRASYGALDEGLGLEIPVPGGEKLAAAFRRVGLGDVYGVNGRNPSGKGVFVGISMPLGFAPIAPSTRRTFARIARHLAAAYRLRRRLALVDRPKAIADADAVLKLDGTVEHAASDAKARDVLDELRRSAVAVATARGTKRFEHPEKAVAMWKALVDARWSLVDHFEHGGGHYLVAHRNDCATVPLARLGERERQVAVLAAMGYSNTAIAYDLGITTASVRVLMSRVLERLGLRSRRQLRALLAKP